MRRDSMVIFQVALIVVWMTILSLNYNCPAMPTTTPFVSHTNTGQLLFPMYYSNLERSTARRAHMERTFGHWGRLVRFPAVDINDEAMINATVDTHGLTAFEYFVNKGKAKGPGAGALLLTKALAAKKAYEEGEEVMLLLEDDMTDALVPFWRYSLADIVKLADENHAGWHFIQLHATLALPKDMSSWKKNPRSPFVARTKENIKHELYGAGAVLISRNGMKMLMDVLFVGRDGKFDCLPEVLSYPAKELVKCNPDNFIWKVGDTSKALLVVPPLFPTMVNEGSTGIRSETKVEKDITSNDNDEFHFEGFVLALRHSVLALAEKNHQMDSGTGRTAKEAGLWYMNDEPHIAVSFDLEWLYRMPLKEKVQGKLRAFARRVALSLGWRL